MVRVGAIIFFVGCLVFGKLNAQDQKKIDSLNREIINSSGANKCELLINLVRQYGYDNAMMALSMANEANHLAVALKDTQKIVQSFRIKGQLLNKLDRPSEAEHVLLSVFAIARSHGYKEDFIKISNNLGIAYTFQAKYDKALKSYLQQLTFVNTESDIAETGVTLNNIAIVYYKMMDYDKAIIYIKRAIQIKKFLNSKDDMDRSLINLSLSYAFKKEYDSANLYLNEAFKVCNDSCQKHIFIEGYYSRGVIYFGMGDLSRAKKYFRKSFTLAAQLMHPRFQLENQLYLAKIELKEGNPNNARKILEAVSAITDTSENDLIKSQIFELLGLIHYNRGNFIKASEKQRKYIALRQKIIAKI
jgi:tetratricopeptide (TPR) repeat protein